MMKKWIHFVMTYLCITCLICACTVAFVYLDHTSVRKSEPAHVTWDTLVQSENPILERAVELYQQYWVLIPAKWRLVGQGITALCLRVGAKQ